MEFFEHVLTDDNMLNMKLIMVILRKYGKGHLELTKYELQAIKSKMIEVFKNHTGNEDIEDESISYHPVVERFKADYKIYFKE